MSWTKKIRNRLNGAWQHLTKKHVTIGSWMSAFFYYFFKVKLLRTSSKNMQIKHSSLSSCQFSQYVRNGKVNSLWLLKTENVETWSKSEKKNPVFISSFYDHICCTVMYKWMFCLCIVCLCLCILASLP